MEAKKGFPKWFIPIVLVFVVIAGISFIRQYAGLININKKENQEKRLMTATFYIGDEVEADPQFAEFVRWVADNHDDLQIPIDYKKDLSISESEFNTYMNEHFNQEQVELFKTGDIPLEHLDYDGQKLYSKYRLEYWYNLFSEIKEKYNLSELSFLYPIKDKENTVLVMIDPGSVDIGNAFLNICQEKYLDPKQHKFLWETWEYDATLKEYDEIPKVAYTNIVKSEEKKVGLIHATA